MNRINTNNVLINIDWSDQASICKQTSISYLTVDKLTDSIPCQNMLWPPNVLVPSGICNVLIAFPINSAKIFIQSLWLFCKMDSFIVFRKWSYMSFPACGWENADVWEEYECISTKITAISWEFPDVLQQTNPNQLHGTSS